MRRLKVLGVNDDTDTCEVCGKTGLKRVVWLERLDADGNGESGPFAAGVDCAGKLLAWSAMKVQRTAEAADRARTEAERCKIHEIGDVRSVRPFVVESVSSQGDPAFLAFANGRKSAVELWAQDRWPNACLNVRPAR